MCILKVGVECTLFHCIGVSYSVQALRWTICLLATNSIVSSTSCHNRKKVHLYSFERIKRKTMCTLWSVMKIVHFKCGREKEARITSRPLKFVQLTQTQVRIEDFLRINHKPLVQQIFRRQARKFMFNIPTMMPAKEMKSLRIEFFRPLFLLLLNIA